MISVSAVVAALALISQTFAHPGEKHDAATMKREIAELQAHASHIKRGLDQCNAHPKFLAAKKRSVARRAAKADALLQSRGHRHTKPRYSRRSVSSLDGVGHNYTTNGYSLSTDAALLFGSNKTDACVLVPEVTQGPYYVAGEYLRTDITEDQAGVPLHMEYQFIDINTCDVVSDIYMEAWHCNATGVYSGVSAASNGVGTADPDNLNKTFLRGVQKADSDGVASFDTIFPGHYTSRSTHIHVLSHLNGTVYPNGTFVSNTTQNVGQVFFDTNLINAVEATSPYNTNTQQVTANSDDQIAGQEAAGDWDPFMDYAYLGESIADGIISWISIGIDTTASYDVSAAANLYESGGVANSDSGMMGGAGMGPSGGMPSGGMPSGGMPSGGMPSGGMPSGAGQSAAVIPSTAGAGLSTTATGSAGIGSVATSAATSAAASVATSAATSAAASVATPVAFGSDSSATTSVKDRSAAEEPSAYRHSKTQGQHQKQHGTTATLPAYTCLCSA